MDKPDVDFIEAPRRPSPSTRRNAPARSHRGHHHRGLRLPAPAVRPHRRGPLPGCGAEVTRQTRSQIVDRIMELPDGTRFQVLAPVVRGRRGTYETLLADLAAQGFARARVDGEVRDVERVELARYEQHTIEVIVDRLVRRDGIERRPTRWRRRSSWPTVWPRCRSCPGTATAPIGCPAARRATAAARTRTAAAETLTFSQHLACPNGHGSFEELALLSVNSPYGACEVCDGLGTRFEVDPELIVLTPTSAWRTGAIALVRRPPALLPAVGGGGRRGGGHRHGRPLRPLAASNARRCSTARASTGCGSSSRTATAASAPTTPTTRA